jgi:hypothetical protein
MKPKRKCCRLCGADHTRRISCLENWRRSLEKK